MLISPAIINTKSTSIPIIWFIAVVLKVERMAVINITVFVFLWCLAAFSIVYILFVSKRAETERNLVFQSQSVKCVHFRRGMYEKMQDDPSCLANAHGFSGFSLFKYLFISVFLTSKHWRVSCRYAQTSTIHFIHHSWWEIYQILDKTANRWI